MQAMALLIWSTLPLVMAQNYPGLAPYPAIRWQNTTSEVRVNDSWYVLLALNDIEVTKIVAFAKQKYDRNWQKRFDEDLVQVLTEMGHDPGKTVKLSLRDLKTNKPLTIPAAPLTEANRRAIMEFKYGGGRPSAPLSAGDLRQALDEFDKAVKSQWSYYPLSKVEIDKAIASLRTKLDKAAVDDFGLELQKIIALGIDGHAAVGGFRLPEGFLPFLCESAGERLVAFQPDRKGLVDSNHPYVLKMDGRDIDEWMKMAAVLAPKGSPQYLRNQSLRGLRNVQFLRKQMALPLADTIEVELGSATGARTTVKLPIAKQPPLFGVWPKKVTNLIANNLGYLRVESMNSRAVQDIRTWMPKFRDTAGLIVDVRDNGGGSRDALLWLFSYLSRPDSAPRVVNCAAYRIFGGFKDVHLTARFMYRADSEKWTDAERKAIVDFQEKFRPQWQPPKGEYSDWHYLVLSRLKEAETFHYDKPVVVLINSKCFSATDIFLAGLKGLPNVTLMGTPSGGGSALVQTVRLGGSRLAVRLGSMVSFQVDGKLFDGHGVQPDVLVDPNPEYFIGGRDNVLEAAIKRLAGGKERRQACN